MKSVVAWCGVLLGVAPVTHCNGGSPIVDGGIGDAAQFDTSIPFDSSGPDAQTACGPLDVSAFQPPTMNPPNAPHAGKCATQQVDDYAQCQGAMNKTLCAEFADGQPGQACRECIETQSTDARWGVLVFQGSGGGTFNIEGCVDDALSQVSQEKASGGMGSCGDALHSSYACQQSACHMCTGTTAFDTCDMQTLTGGCKSYDDAVESPTGPCSSLLGDAAPADATNCFPNAQIADPTQQEVDWLNRIVGYMCGS